MIGHTITRESGEKLSKLLKKDRYQPPLERDTNTRPSAASTSSSVQFFLFTLTTAFTTTTATATIRNLDDDEEIATGVTLRDPLGHFNGLASGKRGFCFKQDQKYYAVTPWTAKVRWNDPDLEYSKDGGTTWINIDTAEDCT